MVVCAAQEPIEERPMPGRRVSCWLYGPTYEIPEGGTEPLERQEIAVADEA